MRRKKGHHGFSRRHSGRWFRFFLLIGLILYLLFLLYSCAVQRMVYSSRGTMIFLPASPLGFVQAEVLPTGSNLQTQNAAVPG